MSKILTISNMQTKDKIFLFFMGVMMLCSLVFTGLIVWNRFIAPHEPGKSAGVKTRQVTNWKALTLQGERVGPVDAPVRIAEFFDYQCPLPAVKAIRKNYPQQVSVVYENDPLSIHQYAIKAALAAECARRQGVFDAYHDSLFEGKNVFSLL